MSSDPNKKTPRTFQCRDSLWQKFEQMARELECSVDYLINDAMKQYARQRGYTGAGAQGPASAAAPSTAGAAPPPPPAASKAAPPPPAKAHPAPAARPSAPPPASRMPAAPPPPPAHAPLPPPPPAPPPGRAAPPPHAPPPPPAPHLPPPPPGPPPSRGAAPPPPPGPPPPPAVPGGRPPAPPPPVPRGAPPPPAAPRAAGGQLAIYYGGERFPINKDRFIIGRGKQSSDLTIKDPNVSRQHAMVEFLNGQYYIVDMGSTNGVEFAGQRVQRKVINDGETFRICDHELKFSYH